VQQSVEDRRGEHLIARHDLGPFPDRFVGGDEHGASSITVRDEPEEQTRLDPIHRLEAHFIDDQERGREVFPTPQLLTGVQF